jgi:hypothetical protein
MEMNDKTYGIIFLDATKKFIIYPLFFFSILIVVYPIGNQLTN